jgi:hypothetical protein
VGFVPLGSAGFAGSAGLAVGVGLETEVEIAWERVTRSLISLRWARESFLLTIRR